MATIYYFHNRMHQGKFQSIPMEWHLYLTKDLVVQGRYIMHLLHLWFSGFLVKVHLVMKRSSKQNYIIHLDQLI